MPDLAQLNLVVKSTEVATAKSRLDDLTRSSSAAERSAGSLEGSYGRLLSMLGKLVGAYAAYNAAKRAITDAAEFQATTVGIANILRDVPKAVKLMSDLNTMAAQTPLHFQDLTKSAKLMLAMQTPVDQVLKRLTVFGDTAAALGGGADTIQRITFNLGQMEAMGKATSRDMRDFAMIGVPAYKYLADVLGTDVAGAIKQVESGTVSSKVAVDALIKGMQHDFGGGMAMLAKMTSGLWSTLTDNLQIASRKMGEAFLQAFSVNAKIQGAIDLTNKYSNTMGDVVRIFFGLKPEVKATADEAKHLADMLDLVFAGIAAITAAKTIMMIFALATEINKVANATKFLSAGLLGPVLAGFAALAGLEFGRYLISQFQSVAKASEEASYAVTTAWIKTKQTVTGGSGDPGSFLSHPLDHFRQLELQEQWGFYQGHINDYRDALLKGDKTAAALSKQYAGEDLQFRPLFGSPLGLILSPAAQWEMEQGKQGRANAEVAKAMGKLPDGPNEDTYQQMLKANDEMHKQKMEAIRTGYDEYGNRKDGGSTGFLNFAYKDVVAGIDKFKQMVGISYKPNELEPPSTLDTLLKELDKKFGSGDVLPGYGKEVYMGEKLSQLTGAQQHLGKINDEMALQVKYATATSEEMDRQKAFLEYREVAEQAYSHDQAKINAAMERYAKQYDMLQLLKKVRDLSQQAADAWADATTDAIMGTKSWEDAIKDLATEIERMVIRQAALQPIANFLSSGVSGFASSIAMGLFGGSGAVAGSANVGDAGGASIPAGIQAPSAVAANGLAFWNGRVVPFANGGALVQGATAFPMAGGRTGIMGEAGPEAVVPLERMADGRLGVRTAGGQQRPIIVQMTVNTPDPSGFRKSQPQIVNGIRRAMRSS